MVSKKGRESGVADKRVGHVDTERFIVFMNQNPLDYTEWRKTQFCNEGPVRALGGKIMAFTAARKNDGTSSL